MNATTNINLKVPFNEKDQAKALGAKWNAELKLWYVPQGIETTPFEKWFTHSSSATPIVKNTPKPSKQAVNLGNQPLDDIDDINARLRDAYELREIDTFEA